MSWFVHGANGAVVQKHVGESKKGSKNVLTVMNKLKHAISIHPVPDLVNNGIIIFV